MSRKTQTSDKPASRRVSKTQADELSAPPMPNAGATATAEEPKTAEEAQDAAQEASLTERADARAAADKIGQVPELAGREWVPTNSLTQAFGQAAIDFYKGDVPAMPRWRFARRYLGEQVILVDTFRTQKEYDEAQVEERRRVVTALGGRYAALGPFHTRLPHNDKTLRDKYPSMVEQLGWR